MKSWPLFGYRKPRIFLITFLVILFSVFGVQYVFAADGSGTASVSVSPSTTLVNSTTNALTFTFTAAETMNSGGISISVPSTWSTPQGSSGTAGYTTVSTNGTVGNVFDEADTVSGWTGNACSGGLTLDTVFKHSGTGSIQCINASESTHDVWYKTSTTQDWSSYTTVGFWIYTDTAFTNSQLKFEYNTGTDLTSIANVEELGFGATVPANTWTYVSFNFVAAPSTRTAVRTYGFEVANASVKSATIHLDAFAVGAGSSFVPTFNGRDIVVTAISLTSGQTITVTYGAGGGAGRAVAPAAPETSTFTVKSKALDSGTLTAVASSPTVSVIDTTAPSVSLTAPTTGSTIHGSSVALTSTASDNVTVSGVKYYLDGVLLGSEVTTPFTSSFDSTAKSDGSHTIVAVARDSSSNYATSTAATVTIDNTGPVISSIASTTAPTTATVTWTTDESSDSKVSYGTVSGTYTTSTSSASSVTSHSIGLTSLSALTTYYYVVVSADASGNISTSTEKTLLTTDTTVPTVSLTAPANGATLRGSSVALTATASDNVAVAGVKFYIDGVLIGSEDTVSAYTGTLDSTGSTDGSHSIVAVARDTSNNYATSTAATVTIDNTAPTAAITYSPNRAVKSGTSLTITATFSEAMANSPVPKIAITGANSLSAADMTKTDTTHYTYAFTVGSGNGTATVSLSTGTDGAGNAITSTPTSGATFTVDNTAPSTPTITSIAGDNMIGSGELSAIHVIGTAEANSLVSVTLSDGTRSKTGTQQLSGGATSFDITIDGTAASPSAFHDGTITPSVTVTDAAGNTSSAATTPTATQDSSIADTTAPSVSLTAPSTGATIHGSSVSLAATASDDSAVAGVKFYIDGVLIGSEDTVSAYTGTLDSTAKSDGSHSIVAVARDTSNNYATSTAATVIIDNTAPIISSISATASSGGATINWTTNESASSQVLYGLTSAYGSRSTETDTSPRVTSHGVTLTGLVSCATYHYTASSTDAVTNSSSDGDNTFTTRGCAGNANVHSQNSHSINHSSGGSASLVGAGATLSLSIPASFGSDDAEFQIKELDKTTALDAIGAPSASVTAAGQVFDLHALTTIDTAQSSFSASLAVTLNYTAGDISGLDESTLKIYRNDSGVWTQLSNCSVNTGAKTVTCDTDHFSTFAIFGQNSSGGSSNNSSSSSGGGGVVIGCTDPKATNYSPMAYGKDTTACRYAPKTSINPASIPPYQFTRQFKLGVIGEDVRQLQVFLNKHGFIIASTGTGSPGNEGTRFGLKTQVALINFQEANAKDILVPQNMTKGSGKFGAWTIRVVNSILAAGK